MMKESKEVEIIMSLVLLIGIFLITLAFAVPACRTFVRSREEKEAFVNLLAIAQCEKEYAGQHGFFLACPLASGLNNDGVWPASAPGFDEIGFAPDNGRIRYQYQVFVTEDGGLSGFTAVARGDLNGDGKAAEIAITGSFGIVISGPEKKTPKDH